MRGPAAGAGAWVIGRAPHLAAAAGAAGLALAPARAAAAVAAAGGVFLAAVAVRAPAAGLVAALALLAGAVVGEARLASIERGRLEAVAPVRVDARAELLERPRPARGGGWRAAVRLTGGPGAGERVLAVGHRRLRVPAGADTGAELALRGTAVRPPPAPAGAFDWAAHLRARGMLVELRLTAARATGARRGGWRGVLDGARRRARAAIAAGMAPRSAALARGMVLGEDEAIAEPVREQFRRSGLAHVLAVSGQNVMLLCALALPLLAALRVPAGARPVALAGLVALYVPLAGAGPSLQRAGVMGLAGLAALLAGRPASRAYALALAALVTLAHSPRAAAQAGWQLSFAAVAAILVLGPALRRPLRGLPRALADGIAVTVAATLGTLPLLAHHFSTVSLAGLPANVVAMPAVAGSMWLGMLQAATGQLLAAGGVTATTAAATAELLGRLNGVFVAWVAGTAEVFSAAPGAALAARLDSPLAVAGAYGALAAGVVAARRAAAPLEPRARAAGAAWRRVPLRRRAIVAAVLAAAAALAAGRAVAPPVPPDRPTVSFLDVGQGDATLVRDGGGGAVLFDGGPPEGDVVGRLRAAGVRRLSAVVATHASRDHHGGLVDVLEQVPVDLLLDGGDGNPDPSFRDVLAAADRRGVRRVRAVAGQALAIGGLHVRVLAPAPRAAGPAPEDPNPRAVVALVTAGAFTVFLSGDAESPSLAPLDLPDVDVMKVPHHGSADPGLPALLARLRPQVAVAQVGAGNPYGHPAPGTLRALAAAGARVLRTDRDGTVTVGAAPGGLTVDAERR